EGNVVDLVRHVLQAGDRGLVLARQVGELAAADVAPLDLLDRRGTVDDLLSGDARDRRAQHHPWAVAASLGGGQPDSFQLFPDRGHVLDPDPVVLDVLPVGDVGGVAGVEPGYLAQHAQLLGAPPSMRTRIMKYESSSSSGSSMPVRPPSIPGRRWV